MEIPPTLLNAPDLIVTMAVLKTACVQITYARSKIPFTVQNLMRALSPPPNHTPRLEL